MQFQTIAQPSTKNRKGLEIMKRKYLAVAVALGLALTFTSMNVAFAATDSTTKITTEAADTTDASTDDSAN